MERSKRRSAESMSVGASFNLSAALLRRLTRVRAALTAQPIVAAALARLQQETPPQLCYHNLEHTNDVISEVLLFGIIDGVEQDDLELLVIAAAYHDVGYLLQAAEHEALSAEIAERALIGAGAAAERRELVCKMILDTKVLIDGEHRFGAPRTSLSGYLRDADLANLGRRDFFNSAQLVLAEQLARTPADLSHTEIRAFLGRTKPLLIGHRWHCRAAQILRQEQKLANIELVERVCRSLSAAALGSYTR